MKQKAIIYLLIFLVAGLVYKWFSTSEKAKHLEEQKIELQRKLEDEKKNEIESIRAKQDSIIESLKNDMKEISEKAKSLNLKLKYYEKNPNIDIDFISAFSIISKSRYKHEQ